MADLKNGQMFQGVPFAWFDARIRRFDALVGGTVIPLAGRAGDVPALTFKPDSQGLHILVHQREMDTLTYKDWETFLTFADIKGYKDIQNAHREHGLPEPPFTEGYTRYCKALVGVGHARGADRNTGLDIEFVALTSPYEVGTDEMVFKLFHNGASMPNHTVALFEKSAQGGVAIETAHRTDDKGVVRVPVRSGHRYLIDAVLLRPASEMLNTSKGLVYESLWASTTFELPD